MRDFLKYTFATLAGLLLFVTLGAAGLVALLVSLASSTRELGPQVEQDSILTIDLAQEITDSPPAADPSGFIQATLSGSTPRNVIGLRTVLNTLEQAAKDDRIKGLYLHGSIAPSGSGSGFATLREVRQALQAFRDSGKPIYAHDSDRWQERDYYLASVANTILLSPAGALEINGFSFETMFFAGALQKYGIGVQTLRAGKYKSAVEPFTRTGYSPENREETQKLLADLWNEFVTTAAKSRNLSPQALQTIANQQGLLLPEQARSAGLIDKVAYEDEVNTTLQQLVGEDKDTHLFRQIDLSSYAAVLAEESPKSSPNRIAVIYAEGDIVNGFGGPGSIGGDALIELLREVRQDEAVKAVVLRVNSPGGSASASEQVAREVLLTAKAKPLIASMGSYAASGGYQISAHANRIIASPTTVTGSIGVFGLLPNIQAIANQNGVTWDRIMTGRLADSDTITRPKTPEELAIGQRVVDRVYDQFLAIVAQSRNLSKDRVNQIAQGRVWSGVAAKQVGLVDDLGGLETAIQEAAKAAKLGDDWQIEEYPKSDRFGLRLERLLGRYRVEAAAARDPLSLQVQKLQQDLDFLRSMNDPAGVYTRLPFNLRID